jgi:hypothetical protein
MSEFLFLYRSKGPSGSPEQMQRQMERWTAWFRELGAQGCLKDIGHPLERAGKMVSGRQKAVNDGPFAEAKDAIGGYSLIEAADLAQAGEIAKGCPALDVDGIVEVRPIRTM